MVQQSEDAVRVRIAPSPTGSPHIGTAWQALFDYVFAKKHKGVFILRLEDTDRARFVPESVNQIKETLTWLGFDYDEGPDIGGSYGPYVQSERLNIYKKYAGELLEKNRAFEDNGALRFRVSKEGKTSWKDLIGDKEISFENSIQEDFVIIKNDGFPTYNFANVIDDHLMEISHVIRGSEFISSTPKHLMIYNAFGWKPPYFAHLPVLVGADRSKLSKRHGAKSALEFRDEGYLKDAVINFLALLGWTHPLGKEIFSLSEMIDVFNFKDFNQASAYFDIKKLEWMNVEYIRKSQISNLKSQISNFYGDKFKKIDDKIFTQFVELAQTRMKTLNDFYILVRPYFEQGNVQLTEKEKEISKNLFDLLSNSKTWDEKSILVMLKKTTQETSCSMKELYKIFTGQESGLPLPQALEIIGKENTLNKLSKN